jgi:hypothetical protein
VKRHANTGVAGIYRIQAPSGNFYIGSSIDMARRFRQHRHELRRGNHHALSLQHAANKYGHEALKFEALFCVINVADLAVVEQYFLDELRPEYNGTCMVGPSTQDPRVAAKVSASAKASAKHKTAREANAKRAWSVLSKPVVRLDDGEVFPSSYAAARAVGGGRLDGVCGAIANGNRWRDFYWAYVDSGVTLADRMRAAAARIAAGAAKSSASMIEARRREIVRLADGVVFRSIADAARAAGCNHSAIHRSLKHRTPCKGSVWAYGEA